MGLPNIRLRLKTPSIWNCLAICSYALAALFHVIAFSSSHWCKFVLDGREVVLGLWTACWSDQLDGNLKCSDQIFEAAVFTTDSNWHIGSRVLMSLALAILLPMEFLLIAYACIDGLTSYRERLAGWIVGMSFAIGGCNILVLLMFGIHIDGLEGGELLWSYGMEVLFFLINTMTFIFLQVGRLHKQRDPNHYTKQGPPSIDTTSVCPSRMSDSALGHSSSAYQSTDSIANTGGTSILSLLTSTETVTSNDKLKIGVLNNERMSRSSVSSFV